MTPEPPTPPAKFPLDERPDDYNLSLPQLLVVRLYAVVIDAITRLGDLAVLVWRPRLLAPYLRLWLREALFSPYRIRRSFEITRLLQSTGQRFNELIYGETPVHSALWLFHKAGLGPGGCLVDLGAGRGRTLFAARWLRAEARGVELLPRHVTIASGPLQRAGARLVEGDATRADLHDATHVFCNWTALSPETRTRLVQRFRTCRPGTRILTVTGPVEAPGFTTLSRHRLLFTWGLEHVWIQEYRPTGEGSDSLVHQSHATPSEPPP